jgi:hypothetical protein
MADRLQLDRIAFYGRTLDEYRAIYDLDIDALRGRRVLDCPGGGASFTAEALAHGIDAYACDVVYGRDLSGVIAAGEADVAHTVERVAQAANLFNWTFYRTPDELKARRLSALHGFAAHYPGGGRYQQAALPFLPYRSGSFDLVLSGHLLFTYSDRLDYAFHLAALRELARVSRGEVRVYPLQGLDAQPYPQLAQLQTDLAAGGISTTIKPVPFEFQRGSDQMIVLSG